MSEVKRYVVRGRTEDGAGSPFVSEVVLAYEHDDAIDALQQRCLELEDERAEQWRLRRDAEADRDTNRAVVLELQAERDALRAEVEVEVEVEELRGIKPDFPPRPPDGDGLPRYGLRWNGPQQPVSVPMDDGYWTPWHLANSEVEGPRHTSCASDNHRTSPCSSSSYGSSYSDYGSSSSSSSSDSGSSSSSYD